MSAKVGRPSGFTRKSRRILIGTHEEVENNWRLESGSRFRVGGLLHVGKLPSDRGSRHCGSSPERPPERHTFHLHTCHPYIKRLLQPSAPSSWSGPLRMRASRALTHFTCCREAATSRDRHTCCRKCDHWLVERGAGPCCQRVRKT
jgi:hypothetical protein